MDELLEKVREYEKLLDKNSKIKRLRELNEVIKGDKELTQKIKRYQITFNEELKKEIYNDERIKEYKELETDINLEIMGINSRLRSISGKGCHHHENN